MGGGAERLGPGGTLAAVVERCLDELVEAEFGGEALAGRFQDLGFALGNKTAPLGPARALRAVGSASNPQTPWLQR